MKNNGNKLEKMRVSQFEWQVKSQSQVNKKRKKILSFDGRLNSHKKYYLLDCKRPIHFCKKYNIGFESIVSIIRMANSSREIKLTSKLENHEIQLLNNFIKSWRAKIIEGNELEYRKFNGYLKKFGGKILDEWKQRINEKISNKPSALHIIYTPVGGKVK